MNKFFTAFCLIVISSIFVFAQDFEKKSNINESLGFAQNKTEIEEFKVNKAEFKEINIDTVNKITLNETPSLSSPQTSDNEYNKNEFFVGYSYQNVDRGDRAHFNGFNVSYVRNISRYIGIKGDVSGTYNNDFFSFTNTINTDPFTISGETKSQIYNFLGGVQFKDNASKKKLKPFAHALVGVAHNRFETSSTCSGDCTGIVTGRANFSDTKFSGAFGGGLDIKINDKIDFRAIQFDYNPVFRSGGADNNFRFGIGFVFK